MKMMMPCTITLLLQLYTFIIIVYYCFTAMHLCPILVLEDEIVTALFVLRQLTDVPICKIL